MPEAGSIGRSVPLRIYLPLDRQAMHIHQRGGAADNLRRYTLI
jgi:hypothetical protein